MSFSRRTLLAALSTDTALRVAAASSGERQIAVGSEAAMIAPTNDQPIAPPGERADLAARPDGRSAD